MLTAREAADRLIVRPASEEQEGRSPYKCEDCGCAEFYVVYSSSDEVTIFEELACECSEEREYAARLKVLIRSNWVKFGRLEDDHRFFLDEYELKDTERENGDLDVACQQCYEADQGSGDPWDSELDLHDYREIENAQRWEVRCRKCNHEVEFGWSHPDRGGQIWPCEATDFDPRKCVPELRFAEDWKLQGWVPRDRTMAAPKGK